MNFQTVSQSTIFAFVIALAGCCASGFAQQGESVLQGDKPAKVEESKPTEKEKRDSEKDEPGSQDLQKLIEKCRGAMESHLRKIRDASPGEQAKLASTSPVDKFQNEFLQIAKQYPSSATGFNALSFLLANGSTASKSVAMKEIVAGYKDDDRIIKSLSTLTSGVPSSKAEQLLLEIANSSKNKKVSGQALLSLLEHIRSLRKLKVFMEEQPDMAKQLGDEVIQSLTKYDFEAASKRESKILDRLVKSYSDVPSTIRGTTLGDIAKDAIFIRDKLSVGCVAPEMVGPSMKRQRLELSSFRGKVVLLLFWGNWSADSRKMFPQLRSLSSKLKGKPFAIVGVNTDHNQRQANITMRDQKLKWECFWDRSTRGEKSSLWQIRSWPTAFILDEKGVIRYRDLRGQEIDEALTAMMKARGFEVDLSDHASGMLRVPTLKDPENKKDPGNKKDPAPENETSSDQKDK